MWRTADQFSGPKLKRLAFVLVVIAALGLSGFIAVRMLIGGSSVSWHQRLTVIVDTPNGEVRGAAVVEITKTETMGPLVPMEARGVHGDVRGEAVAVEVLPGRWLFALLSDDVHYKGEAGQLVYSAFRLGMNRDVTERTYENSMADLWAQPLDTPAPVPADAFPLLVTFDDISRPETVAQVDPANLAAIFGPGVSLTGMTLEVTEAAVTEGRVEEVLRWLRSIWPNMLDGRRFETIDASNRLANSLGANSFSTEIKK